MSSEKITRVCWEVRCFGVDGWRALPPCAKRTCCWEMQQYLPIYRYFSGQRMAHKQQRLVECLHQTVVQQRLRQASSKGKEERGFRPPWQTDCLCLAMATRFCVCGCVGRACVWHATRTLHALTFFLMRRKKLGMFSSVLGWVFHGESLLETFVCCDAPLELPR